MKSTVRYAHGKLGIVLATLLICAFGTTGVADAKLKFQSKSRNLNSLIQQNAKKVVLQSSNVQMHYGAEWPNYNVANYTMAYNGTQYVYNGTPGAIKVGDRFHDLVAASYLWIKFGSPRHEHLTSAYAYYSGWANNPDGDVNNPLPVYVSFAWAADDVIPLAFQKKINGVPYILTLTSASAFVKDDRLPMPSLVSSGSKGGGNLK